MPQFCVTSDEADICYIVNADSKSHARYLVFEFFKRSILGAGPLKNTSSLRRLDAAAKNKRCSPHVLLKAEPLTELTVGIASIYE